MRNAPKKGKSRSTGRKVLDDNRQAYAAYGRPPKYSPWHQEGPVARNQAPFRREFREDFSTKTVITQ